MTDNFRDDNGIAGGKTAMDVLDAEVDTWFGGSVVGNSRRL